MEGPEFGEFLGEEFEGRAAGLGVETHVGDILHPVARAGIEGVEAGEIEAAEEVALDVPHGRLDASLLLGLPGSTRPDLEAVVLGQIDIAGMKGDGTAAGMIEHGGFAVVDPDLGRNTSEVGECVLVGAQEELHGLTESELEVKAPTVSQDQDEEADASAGVAALDPPGMSPIDLSTLTGEEVES